MARTVLGWSEAEFWQATPRMFYAFFFTYVDLQTKAVDVSSKQQVLVGKDAISALTQFCG